MLNRLTISALLKSVIAVMAACVVAFLIMTAWESWGRLQTAARISVIADGSAHAFKAMSNLRTDRATTSSEFEQRRRHTADALKTQQGYRDIINPALRSLLDLAATVEFPERATLLPSLTRQFDTLKALQTETIAAIGPAEGVAPGRAWQGICRCRHHVAADAGKAGRPSSPPPSATSIPWSINCWRSSRSPGWSAIPAVRPPCCCPRDSTPAACRRKRARPTPNSPSGRNTPGRLWRPWWREPSCRPAWSRPWLQPRRPISNRNIWRSPSDC